MKPYDRTRTAAKSCCSSWVLKRDLPSPGPSSEDVPCNVSSHLMIRQGCLEWLQVMRSNDLIWGTPYNFVQFTSIQEIVAGWLGVEVGNYVHVSDSLHVYQRHWAYLDEMALDIGLDLPRNRVDLRIEGYDQWEQAFGLVADAAVKLSKGASPEEAQRIVDRVDDLPVGYREWIALLATESLRRGGHDDAALSMVDRAGVYWAKSWQSWYDQQLGASASLTNCRVSSSARFSALGVAS